jgi:hypothetical protein
MDQEETYRCDGCGAEYSVSGTNRPTVICPDCDQVATPRGNEMARRAYKLGYTKYLEARRQVTEALERFESGDMALARGGFNDAAAEFEASVDHFTTAVSRATDDPVTAPSERARKKATCLWQAAEWLSGAAYAAEQAASEQASSYRSDAQQRLRAAREYGDLTEPDRLAVPA